MINILFKIILCYLDISTLWTKFFSIPNAKHQKSVFGSKRFSALETN